MSSGASHDFAACARSWAALGSVPALHAAFRRECVLHRPLFAGFPGFRSKLWVDDVQTGVYRGIYDWGGAEGAEA